MTVAKWKLHVLWRKNIIGVSTALPAIVAAIAIFILSSQSHLVSESLSRSLLSEEGVLSSNHNDVLGIRHDSLRHSLSVDFTSNGACNNPVLRGRLSGPALSMIEWEPLLSLDTMPPGSSRRTITGHYSVPFAGVYYVEIFVVLCELLQYEQDFRNLCLKQPSEHRLTSSDARIVVDFPHTSTSESLGHWVSSVHSQHVPLQTRFQPPQCRRGNRDPRCLTHTDLRRFDPYQFVPSASNIGDEDSRLQSNQTVCVVGASHAEVIRGIWTQHAQSYGISVPDPIGVQFPRDLTEVFIEDKVLGAGCTKVLVGIGQWPAGWPGGSPTLFHQFEQQMQQAIKTLQRVLADKCDLFIRTVHYNPLGDMILDCPPRDWRSPPVIDGYNRALKRVCEKLSVPLIDTNFIISPMWDSAEDWCHYKDKVGRTDALFILKQMLQ